MNYTDEQLQKKFETLPTTVQNYILSDEVIDAMDELTWESGFKDNKPFRQAVFALLVGIASGEDFTWAIQKAYGIESEETEHLFGEVGDRIMLKAYDLYNEVFAQTPAKPADSATKPATAVPQPPAPARATGDARKFVGLPNYGVEKPASSYTSVLPRSQADLNKLKDTPTADSFIKRLGSLGNQSSATAAAANPVSPKAPATPAPAPTPTPAATLSVPVKTAPPPENLPVLQKNEPPVELAKLTRPVNLPRREVDVTPPPAPKPPMPQAPKPSYPKGTDPYREAPTP